MVNKEGEGLADHNGAACTFIFTKTEGFKEDTRAHTEIRKSRILNIFSTIEWLIRDAIFVFVENFHELLTLLGIRT